MLIRDPVDNVSASDSRLAAFDGLRALAVFGVIVQHSLFAEARNWTPGPIGVRLFFVLSGFLITGILIAARTHAEAGRVPRWMVWRAFMQRRALRIFPLAYLAMATAWFLGSPAMTERGWWHLLYVGNIDMGFSGELTHRGLSHFWSLAIEEQFYVVWPLIMLTVPLRACRGVILTVVVAGALLRMLTVEMVNPWAAYVLPWSRMDALAFGGLLAIAHLRVADLLMAGAGLSLLSAMPAIPESARFTLNESGVVIFSGAMVLTISRGWGTRLLSRRPVVFLGSISYGLYVWSGLLPFAMRSLERRTGLPLFPDDLGWPQLLATFAYSVILAVVSWRFLERPLNDLKRLFPYVPSPHPVSSSTRICARETNTCAVAHLHTRSQSLRFEAD